MIKNKKIFFILLVIIIIVVIYEVIVLIKPSKKNTIVLQEETKKQEEVVGKAEVVLKIKTNETKMVVGKQYFVTVSVTALRDIAIDGADMFVKFDPIVFKASDVKQGLGLPNLVYKKIKDTGLVAAGLYITEKAGLVLKANEEKDLISFQIEPKEKGKYVISLNTKQDDPQYSTTIAETQTAKVIPFKVEKLNVNVLVN